MTTVHDPYSDEWPHCKICGEKCFSKYPLCNWCQVKKSQLGLSLIKRTPNKDRLKTLVRDKAGKTGDAESE